jgi:asparagine synthase (glutamine-hydrolysing)
MCGIVGAFNFSSNSFKITEPYLVKMRDTMLHRGPDGGGVWISNDGKVGFGHRRLSIIDLSTAAAQPMSNKDETLWISFNGEIYNHAEIRTELENLGQYQWKTDHSDTEVILHAFEEWGIDCIHRFRGMFGIALWDEKKRELWLIRDRIGIKPVYYSIHNGRLVFASEIKALLEDPDQKKNVDVHAFYHYLSFLTTPAPDTLFDGVKKLPCGSWLRVSEDGTFREHRYWDVWDYTEPLTHLSEEDISHRLLSELRTAVQLRKVSDVPAGVFLSGGIDSSTNAALFSEGESSPVKTFTIGYEGNYKSYQNENHFAKQMASTVKADYYEKLLNMNDLLDFLPKMVHLQDEPLADPVCVPVYYLSKLARDHGVIVAQVGEGSDELFWGYRHWRTLLNLQRWNQLPVPVALKKTGLLGLQLLGRKTTFEYEFLKRGTSGHPIFWGGAEAFSDEQKQRLLSDSLRRELKGYSSWSALSPIWERYQEKAYDKHPLNWMTYLDLNLRLPELLLMRVDKMSMGVALEARVPFLDHKFVELAMSVPASLKVKNGQLKYILKKSVRGLIPDDLIDRRKQGFAVPIYEWFFDQFGDRARQELESFCDQTDFLNYSEITKLMSRGQRSKVWYLLNFALWWKEYIQ